MGNKLHLHFLHLDLHTRHDLSNLHTLKGKHWVFLIFYDVNMNTECNRDSEVTLVPFSENL